MSTQIEKQAVNWSTTGLPMRLHHNAYVTNDQGVTREFYEDILGMPLVATWKESDVLFGKERVYCHTFYGLADGSALAFFQFASPEDQAEFGPEMPHSPFQHIATKVDAATQETLEKKLKDANWKPEETYVLDHGYCRSLYTVDPNGLLLEFTVDALGVEEADAQRRETARADLESWLAGDYTSNNNYR